MAATSEFAANGFAGARVDRIAESAGFNKSLVYHYFGGKKQLYTCVLRATYEKIRNGEKELKLSKSDPKSSLRTLIRFTFEHYRDNPEFVMLLTAENFVEGKYLRDILGVKELQAPLISQLASLIDEGIERGDFKFRVDPVRIYILIASMAFFPRANRHTLSTVFSIDTCATEWMEEQERLCATMVLGLLGD